MTFIRSVRGDLMACARKTGGLAMLAAVFAIGTPALAATQDDAASYVRVSRVAVTPSNPAEARRSLGRLGSAAMEACGASFFSLPEHKEAVRNSACWQESMRDVVARIDNQYLTAAYHGRGMVEVAANQGGSATHAR